MLLLATEVPFLSCSKAERHKNVCFDIGGVLLLAPNLDVIDRLTIVTLLFGSHNFLEAMPGSSTTS